jgi:tRNA pseudouridine55 synthase
MPESKQNQPSQGERSGIVLVDKPAGWTSHDVVARMRRKCGTKKVGHAGTLDPMATGLLIVGVNRATRLLGHLAGHDKTYRAVVRLGQRTGTDDAEGEIIQALGAAGLAREDVDAALEGFRGTFMQVPSSVSAIKVDGKRAYARVRGGEEVQLAAREVTVSALVVDSFAVGEVDGLPVADVGLTLSCSSGTYVRALARDLGDALGTGGHLTQLRRTRIGGFALPEFGALAGLPVLSAEAVADPESRDVSLVELSDAVRLAFPVVELSQADAQAVRHGRPLPFAVAENPTAVFHEGDFLALYRPDGGRSVPLAVFVV